MVMFIAFVLVSSVYVVYSFYTHSTETHHLLLFIAATPITALVLAGSIDGSIWWLRMERAIRAIKSPVITKDIAVDYVHTESERDGIEWTGEFEITEELLFYLIRFGRNPHAGTTSSPKYLHFARVSIYEKSIYYATWRDKTHFIR